MHDEFGSTLSGGGSWPAGYHMSVQHTSWIAVAIPGQLEATPSSTNRLVLVRRSEAGEFKLDARLSDPTADLCTMSPEPAAIAVSSSHCCAVIKSSTIKTGGSTWSTLKPVLQGKAGNKLESVRTQLYEDARLPQLRWASVAQAPRQPPCLTSSPQAMTPMQGLLAHHRPRCGVEAAGLGAFCIWHRARHGQTAPALYECPARVFHTHAGADGQANMPRIGAAECAHVARLAHYLSVQTYCRSATSAAELVPRRQAFGGGLIHARPSVCPLDAHPPCLPAGPLARGRLRRGMMAERGAPESGAPGAAAFYL
eukprot:scaffold2779_cov376-Prasinococcus_capsulatus_cf.AAC.4